MRSATIGPGPRRHGSSGLGAVGSAVRRSTSARWRRSTLSRRARAPGAVEIVGIVGAAGVGKSRLCQEFRRDAARDGWEVYGAHGLAHRREVAGLALGELARSLLAGTTSTDLRSSAPGETPVPEGPRPLDDDAVLAPESGAPPEGDAPALAQALARRVREAADTTSIVLLLDDAHWMDPTSLTALEQIVAAGGELCHPGADQASGLGFGARGPPFDYQQIALLPWTRAPARRSSPSCSEATPSLDALPERLRERAAGNPFFLEEMVRALVDAGTSAANAAIGGWSVRSKLDALAVPSDVARAPRGSDRPRLAERDKHVVEAAAVIGRRFVLCRCWRGWAALPGGRDRRVAPRARAPPSCSGREVATGGRRSFEHRARPGGRPTARSSPGSASAATSRSRALRGALRRPARRDGGARRTSLGGRGPRVDGAALAPTRDSPVTWVQPRRHLLKRGQEEEVWRRCTTTCS